MGFERYNTQRDKTNTNRAIKSLDHSVDFTNDISTIRSNPSGQDGFLPDALPNIFKARNMSIPSPPN